MNNISGEYIKSTMFDSARLLSSPQHQEQIWSPASLLCKQYLSSRYKAGVQVKHA